MEERYKQLAKASTHGERFFVTGGDHACTDDVFKAFEYKERLQKIESMTKDKSQRIEMEKVESRALAVLELGKAPDDLRLGQLQAVLVFWGADKKKVATSKYRLVKMYEEMKKNKKCIPKKFNRWTAEDEAELKGLQGEVDIKDTALGKNKNRKRKQHPEDVTVTSSEESDLGSLLETLLKSGEGADLIADMKEKAKAILAAVDKNNAVNTQAAVAAAPKTVDLVVDSDDSTVSIIPPWASI